MKNLIASYQKTLNWIECKPTLNGNFLIKKGKYQAYITSNGKILTVWNSETESCQWEYLETVPVEERLFKTIPTYYELENAWGEQEYDELETYIIKDNQVFLAKTLFLNNGNTLEYETLVPSKSWIQDFKPILRWTQQNFGWARESLIFIEFEDGEVRKYNLPAYDNCIIVDKSSLEEMEKEIIKDFCYVPTVGSPKVFNDDFFNEAVFLLPIGEYIFKGDNFFKIV